MKLRRDQGMTLLEVSLAMAILMMGVGFVWQSDALTHRYQAQYEQRQQMLFYGAGQIEALVQGQTVTSTTPPFSNYQVDTVITEQNPYLEEVKLTISVNNSTHPPEPVTIYTYRIKP